MKHNRLLSVLFLLAAVTTVAISLGLLDVPLKKTPTYEEVYFSVAIADTRGWKPMDFLERNYIAARQRIEIAEFPTLYCIRYFDNGAVEDCGLKHQQWWRPLRRKKK